MITSFCGEYFFLSNFYNAPVTWRGVTYKNNEAAFQSAKARSHAGRARFACLNPSEAKRRGRSIPLRPDWEEIKYDVMYEVCMAKFSQNPDLKDKLLATGNRHLEEGNTWGDTVWGTVNGVGQNNLGKILMRVRGELATMQPE